MDIGFTESEMQDIALETTTALSDVDVFEDDDFTRLCSASGINAGGIHYLIVELQAT